MNTLTQSAFTALSELWVRVSDLDDTKAGTPLQLSDTWIVVANMCEAYSLQHLHAQHTEEGDTFSWLQDIAEHRAAMVRRRAVIPNKKLGIVSAMGEVLR